MLTPLTNNILFVFVDNIINGKFVENTASGIFLGNGYEDTIKKPRWGKVVAVGPDVKKDGSISTTDLILVEPLMWTEGFMHDGIQIWKTNLTKVMATQSLSN